MVKNNIKAHVFYKMWSVGDMISDAYLNRYHTKDWYILEGDILTPYDTVNGGWFSGDRKVLLAYYDYSINEDVIRVSGTDSELRLLNK